MSQWYRAVLRRAMSGVTQGGGCVGVFLPAPVEGASPLIHEGGEGGALADAADS